MQIEEEKLRYREGAQHSPQAGISGHTEAVPAALIIAWDNKKEKGVYTGKISITWRRSGRCSP